MSVNRQFIKLRDFIEVQRQEIRRLNAELVKANKIIEQLKKEGRGKT